MFKRQLNLNYMQPKKGRVVGVKAATPSGAYCSSVVMTALTAVMYKQE